MARSILSFGMLCDRAVWMALRSRTLPLGSPPPVFAAMEISFDNLLKSWPRFASVAPLKRLIFDHLLCPDITWEFFDYESCRQTWFRVGNRTRKASKENRS